MTTLETIVQLTTVVVHVATVSGIALAIYTYRENQSLERAKWAAALYEKFYEKPDLKGMRRVLDCPANDEEVRLLVEREAPDFTDYLNFFEHVTYLVECRRLRRRDVLAYFSYYISCLSRHEAVLAYIKDRKNDYQSLASFLAE